MNEIVELGQEQSINVDIDLFPYHSETSLFQSQIWADFNQKLPGQTVRKLENFQVYETNDLIYIPGVTKNQLKEDCSSLISILNYIRDSCNYKRLAIDFQILQSDEVSTRIETLLNSFGLKTSGLYWLPRRRCVVDLSKDMDRIVSDYYNKTYNDIRRAIKNRVYVIESWDIECFYRLYLRTARKHKFQPISIDVFNILCEHLKTTRRGKLLFASKDGFSMMSAALICGYNKVLYYMFTGSSSNYHKYNASSLLQHTIIEYAKNNSYRFYDLMGVRNDFNFGPSKFKMKFGSFLLKLIDTYINFN